MTVVLLMQGEPRNSEEIRSREMVSRDWRASSFARVLKWPALRNAASAAENMTKRP